MISPIPANGEVECTFRYYQPLPLDAGVGRYHYPLEEGGTDERANTFWTTNERVSGAVSLSVEVRTGYPLDSVRVPGFEDGTTTRHADNHLSWKWSSTGPSALNRDFVFYYPLRDGLSGRVERMAYREDTNKPGTFLLSVTPGIDLEPLSEGSDYLFVVDTFGSLESKLGTVLNGIGRSLESMRPHDRFRIILFSDTVTEPTGGWHPATAQNIASIQQTLKQVRSAGGTKLHTGIGTGLFVFWGLRCSATDGRPGPWAGSYSVRELSPPFSPRQF